MTTEQLALGVVPKPAAVDSLIRGTVRGQRIEGRVYHVSSFGWVAFVDADEKQWIAYAGHFDVVGDPRPLKHRTDIPERLR